jgi:hypothetical protein
MATTWNFWISNPPCDITVELTKLSFNWMSQHGGKKFPVVVDKHTHMSSYGNALIETHDCQPLWTKTHFVAWDHATRVCIDFRNQVIMESLVAGKKLPHFSCWPRLTLNQRYISSMLNYTLLKVLGVETSKLLILLGIAHNSQPLIQLCAAFTQ